MSTAAPQLQWRIAREDRAKTAELAKALEVPRLVAHLLSMRGVHTPEEGRRFLRPSTEALSDPFLLTDMKLAVERILKARDQEERVLIFGDYDVDGIAGTAILLRAFQAIGIKRCECGMPSRLHEGYGLSAEHVATAAGNGINLIVTVDNGINAREAADAAARAGLDLVVTDHHQIEGPLPQAVAVVNPKREHPSHPAAEAAGAAVAFKLAQALTGKHSDLDLVALGSVADIVPLRGENRALVALGLEEMVRRPRVGIKALAAASNIEMPQINAEKIAFQLAPRLNAAGRLGDGALPLQLLLTESADEARLLAQELDDANVQRRDIEKDIFEQAVEIIEPSFSEAQRSIVLGHREWHPGVIGVVASRLYGRYNRPVVLVAIDDEGTGRGSARANEAFDMASALAECKQYLLRFGGHSAAAGLALSEDQLDAFRDAFEEEARKRTIDLELTPTLDIDALVSLSEIDPQLVGALNALEPFGSANPAPVFCCHAVTVSPQSVKELQGGHVRLAVRQGPRSLAAIGFRMADIIPPDVGGKTVDIAFTPRFNTWRGETTIQLLLRDLRVV